MNIIVQHHNDEEGLRDALRNGHAWYLNGKKPARKASREDNRIQYRKRITKRKLNDEMLNQWMREKFS